VVVITGELQQTSKLSSRETSATHSTVRRGRRKDVLALANVGQLLNLSSQETHDAAAAPDSATGPKMGVPRRKAVCGESFRGVATYSSGGSGSAFVMRNSSGQVGSRCEWTGIIESEAKTAAGAQRGISSTVKLSSCS